MGPIEEWDRQTAEIIIFSAFLFFQEVQRPNNQIEPLPVMSTKANLKLSEEK